MVENRMLISSVLQPPQPWPWPVSLSRRLIVPHSELPSTSCRLPSPPLADHPCSLHWWLPRGWCWWREVENRHSWRILPYPPWMQPGLPSPSQETSRVSCIARHGEGRGPGEPHRPLGVRRWRRRIRRKCSRGGGQRQYRLYQRVCGECQLPANFKNHVE